MSKSRNNAIVCWPYDFLWLMPPIGGKATRYQNE